MLSIEKSLKVLALFKLKAFTNNKLKTADTAEFVLDRAENIVGKGENAGYQHFLLFPQCFHEAALSEMVKPGTGEGVNSSFFCGFK